MDLKITRRFASLTILGGVLAVSACTTMNGSANQPAPKLQAAWVVLGEQGQAIARAITSDSVCPTLLQDGVASAMQVRAQAETVAVRKTASEAQLSKASAFPVLTCDAPLQAATRSASIAGQDLPLPKPVAQKIVVIGDTGCRLKSKDKYFQSCNDSDKWAFRDMVETAARFKPDLVVHVGDYQYRENPCPEGNKECAGSPWGYGWDTWQADFFSPAAALLKAAPWVVVRGNHESCTRAGQGWWRFMDPRPMQPGRDCNLEKDDVTGDYSAPYAVPLGTVGKQSAQFIVFDSSKVPNKVLAKDGIAYQNYLSQLKTVNQLSESADFNIFINHHPVLGFAVEKNLSGGLEVYPGNLALQDVMQSLNANRLFPAKIQASISGHVHLFEALTYTSGQPVQFVTGNGGSSLDMPLSTPLSADATPLKGAHLDFFSNSNEVGFTTLEREQNAWKVQAWNRQGKLLTTCQMQDQKTTCQNPQH